MPITSTSSSKKNLIGPFRLTLMAAAMAMALPCYAQTQSGSVFTNDIRTISDDILIDWKTPDENGKVWKLGEDRRFGVAALPGGQINLTGKNIGINVETDAGFNAIGVHAIPSGSDPRRTQVQVGSANSQTRINLKSEGWIIGVWAYGEKNADGAEITINGNSLVIDAESTGNSPDDTVYAIYAQNTTTPETLNGKERATVIVNADNTVINAKSAAGQASGIVAMSQGIVKVNGNLEVNADSAIVARGDAIVRINEGGDKTVKLNGDIDFDYNQKTSGTTVDADVLVNLNGTGSYWNGNAKVSYDTKPADDKSQVSGLQLGIANGAQWSPTVVVESDAQTNGTKAVAINRLALNDGIINVNHGGAQTVKIETLSGNGGTVNIRTATADGKTFDAGSLEVGQVAAGNGTPAMAVNFTGITADDVVDMTNLKDKVKVADKSNGGIAQTQTVAEGVVKGTLTQTVDENGDVTSMSERRNTGTLSLKEIGAMNFLTFRAQMNDLDKRMGDLRTMPQASGMWARAIAGQSEYKSIHNTYQTLQVGADRRIGNFYVGGAVNYTDGDGKLDNGSTDDKNYGFGIYGGWLGEDGQFVDVIVKRSKLETDFDIGYLGGAVGSGSYDTWGTSASVEYGWRFGVGQSGYYLEPQAEFMIGHLNGVGYTNRTSLGDVRVRQDGIKTAVGRLGVATGWVSPDRTGSLYIKASVMHDWEGDAKTRTEKDGVSRSYTEEMGGTWGEFALGGTWNISKDVAAYGEVETTAGNPVRTTYQVSAGLRYSF